MSFAIPSYWKEEYEAEGGGTFYEDNPDSGTLRLNVLSLSNKKIKSESEVIRDIFANEDYEVLPSGFPIRTYIQHGQEKGKSLNLYRWEVLVPITKSHFRLVCFSYTLLAEQEGSEMSVRELQIVDSSIREAHFSTESGATKPWWKFWR